MEVIYVCIHEVYTLLKEIIKLQNWFAVTTLKRKLPVLHIERKSLQNFEKDSALFSLFVNIDMHQNILQQLVELSVL